MYFPLNKYSNKQTNKKTKKCINATAKGCACTGKVRLIDLAAAKEYNCKSTCLCKCLYVIFDKVGFPTLSYILYI